MPKIAVAFGVLLILLGVGAFVGTGASHFTSLIPTIFGTPILLAGVLAIAKPNLRKHAMHVAAMFGLLGAAGGLGMGIPKMLTLMAGETIKSTPLAVSMQVAMGVISLVFLVLCVKSFIDARRARTQTPAV